jgi:glycerol dehydrogenase-like iron-containing ADH family enzyme
VDATAQAALDAIAAALRGGTASAYGELFAQMAAGADWLLAAAVAGEGPVPPDAWRAAQEKLAARTLHPHEAAAGDPDALADLRAGLAGVAEAVRLCGSDRPVASAAHAFADVWSLAGLGRHPALGTLCAMVVWGKLFERPFAEADIPAAVAGSPALPQREDFARGLFPDGALRERALAAVRAKTPAPDALRARLLRAASLWEPLRAKCDAQLMAPERAAAMLHAAGCAVDPAALGLPPPRLAASALAAQLLAPRYTVLDLAYETGRLPACAEALAAAFA